VLPGEYLVGFALLSLMVTPVVLGAVRIRQRVLRGWYGPPARLAEATISLALLVCTLMLLGAFGALERVPAVLACVAVGAAAVVVARPRAAVSRDHPPPAPPIGPRGARLMVLLAAVAALLVAVQWLPHVVTSYQRGMLDGDTMWYHAPFAARFVQSGWTTRLLFTNYEPLVTFFPANSELIDAIAILPFHHDILLPALNLGWLAMALLAGWCVGRPYGAGPLGTAAVAVVMSLPVMAATQAGTLRNDTAAVALFVTAVALLLNAGWRPAAMAVAGLAAGLAAGTKVDLIGPVVVLAAAAAAAVPSRRSRLLSAGPLVAAATGVGCLWYLRNLARVGNPLPWFGLHLGPIAFPAVPTAAASLGSRTLASHATEGAFWTRAVLPGLHLSLGALWPLVLAAAAAGAVLGVVTGGSLLLRLLGIVAALCGVIYLFTPNSAPGALTHLDNVNFAVNLRYLAPSLVLGLVLVSALPGLAVAARRVWAEAVLVATTAADLYSPSWLQFPEMTLGRHALGAGVSLALVAGVLAAVFAWRSRRPRGFAARWAAALAALCVAAGYPVQRSYLQHRYATVAFPTAMAHAYPWAQTVHDRRIAITDDFFQYPLYGSNLSNWVQTVGRNGPDGAFEPVTSCRSWWAALRAGRYDYVVISPPIFLYSEPRERAWTISSPAARLVPTGSVAVVYRLDHSLEPSNCG
jgi:hypothetical protein